MSIGRAAGDVVLHAQIHTLAHIVLHAAVLRELDGGQVVEQGSKATTVHKSKDLKEDRGLTLTVEELPSSHDAKNGLGVLALQVPRKQVPGTWQESFA